MTEGEDPDSDDLSIDLATTGIAASKLLGNKLLGQLAKTAGSFKADKETKEKKEKEK